MLVQYDVNTGSRTDVSIADATVAKNFYTVVLPDGTRSDAWERSLSEVEHDIAPALRRAIDAPRFGLSDDDRQLLASWIALQYLRGPDNRQLQAAIGSFTVRAQVGMGGLAYLQHVISNHLARSVRLEQAERVWDDITKEEGPTIKIRGEDHLNLLLHAFPQAAEQILGRTWGRMRFRRRTLAVSDVPVGLVRDSAEPWAGGGLGGARAITVPLDRHTLLWLALAGPEGPQGDMDLEPTKAFAVAHNESAIGAAERFVYFHPADDPIAEGTVVPRPPRERLTISGGIDLGGYRDRALNEVLQQVAARNGRNDGSLIAGLHVAYRRVRAAGRLRRLVVAPRLLLRHRAPRRLANQSACCPQSGQMWVSVTSVALSTTVGMGTDTTEEALSNSRQRPASFRRVRVTDCLVPHVQLREGLR